jgi:hypothetical protein
MTDYVQVSIKSIPKFQSPYNALVSENFDESVLASIIQSDLPEDKIPTTPLEKVMMA